jgi:predicted amidohydrolase
MAKLSTHMNIVKALLAFACLAANANAAPLHVWEKVEITLQASNTYANAYTDAQVWVDLHGPGFARRCYGFWDGVNTFRVRVLATAPGKWSWRSGSQPADPGLAGHSGAFDAVSWTEAEKPANPCRRGNLRATANGHAFEYADGSPCFLVGDTWWATPTFRFRWHADDTPRPLGPEAGFKDYVRWRRQQGFNCIALIAALPNWANDGQPATLKLADGTILRSAWREAGTERAKDMTNEFGQRAFLFPGKAPGFENVFPDVERLNPAYFQTLDWKLDYLNAQGFIPFIEVARRDLGQAWKKFYPWPQSYARFIQYVWSRYQAHIALFSPIHFDTPAQSIPPEEWNRAAKAVLEQFGSPPFGTLVGNNANPSSLRNWGHVDQAPWLGFHQIGNRRTHDCYAYLTEIFQAKPPLPGINGEPYYDGMEDAAPGSELAALYCRSAMYGSVLSGGLGGHIYGAGGWQGGLWSGEVEPASKYPLWEVIRWESADQMRHLKSFILSEGRRYQELEPATNALSPNRSGRPNGLTGWAYAARTPDRALFLLYFERDCPPAMLAGARPNGQYRARWFNPRRGEWLDAERGVMKADGEGRLVLPPFPGTSADWALKLTSTGLPPASAKPQTVRVAGVVLKWLRGDKEANYHRLEPLIRQAAAHQAQIVCTTECFLDGYAIADKTIPLEQYRALGEPIPEGQYFRKLAALAKELKIVLIAGMLEAEGEHRFNTAALIGPSGQLIGKYHKQQLEHEAVRNTAGRQSSVFETPFGKIGVMICADRRFPDVVQGFCERGADFLICPSGGMFGPKSNDHILQARSKENGKFIVFVHPAEFLVTGPDGALVERTLLGDKLLLSPDQVGTEADSQRVFYFDLPLKTPEDPLAIIEPKPRSGRLLNPGKGWSAFGDVEQRPKEVLDSDSSAVTYVKTSARDPRYFELSDGRPYVPIGFNLVRAPKESEFESVLDAMAANQINYCRIWLNDLPWQIEHAASGVYDEGRVKILRRFLDLAGQRGVRVKLCLEEFRELKPTKQADKDNTLHHRANGGPFTSMQEFLYTPQGQALFLRKVAFYRKHIGDHPAVFAWELWNEMDCVRADWVKWTEHMLPELHRLFPRNMVVQSLGSFDTVQRRKPYERLSLMAGNDAAQVHRYLDLRAQLEVCHGPMDVLAADAVRELLAFKPAKPVLLAETGAVSPGHTGVSPLYAPDKEGMLLHDVIFAPFFAGAAGTGEIWFWRESIQKPNLWHRFARFARAIEGIDPAAEHFEPVMVEHPRLRIYLLKGRDTLLAWCRDARNDWRAELERGEAPERLAGLTLDLREPLKGCQVGTARAYSPWTDVWSDLEVKEGLVVLPAFQRSLVIHYKTETR